MTGGDQHRGAGDRMPDEDGRGLDLALHIRRRRDHVLAARRMRRLVAAVLGPAAPREVEAEDSDARLREGPRDVPCRLEILGGVEAMNEEGAGENLAIG